MRVLSRYDERHESAARGAAVRSTNKAAAKQAGAAQDEGDEDGAEEVYSSPTAPTKRGLCMLSSSIIVTYNCRTFS